MPTVIDSLYVLLGLDPSEFEKGRKQASEGLKKTRAETEKTGETMGDFGKKAGNAMAGLRNEALGLFLAFQGASSVKDFVGNMITGDAATGRLAKNLGVTTQELSAYGLAVKSVGGDAKEVEAAFGMLASARESLTLTGNTGHDREFMLLGFSGRDLDNTTAAFAKLAEAAQRMPRTQFYNLAKQMGLSEGVINLLQIGPVKMAALVEARKADAAATDDQSRASAELEAHWADLSAKLTKEVRPGIYDFVTGLSFVVDKFVEIREKGTTGSKTLDDFGLAAKSALNPVGTLVDLVGKLGFSMADLGAIYERMVINTHGWIGGDGEYSRIMRKGVAYGPNGAVVAGGAHVMHGAEAEAFAANVRAGGNGTAPGAALKGGGAGFGGNAGNSRWIQETLRGSGFTAEQARGIAAGIAAEGGSLGRAANGAFGIGQWLGPRARALHAKYGAAPTKEQQMAFLIYELKGGDAGGASVMRSRSAQETLSNYIGETRANGTGWGFMRPRYGAERVNDMRRGMAQLGQRYAGDGGGSRGASTTIGTIVVNTRATDGEGIARDLPPAIRRRSMTAQAATGLE